MADSQTLTARWVFPVDRPPLLDGTITVRGDQIEAVEPFGTRTADENLGNVAILPGLVNCHTHLDLTGMRGKCPPGPDFCEWLRGVVRDRLQRPTEQVEADTSTGLAEASSYGTTLLGDIANQGRSWAILARSPIRSVVFYELIGLTWPRAEAAWNSAGEWLKSHPATPTCLPGLSPHAPYSVHVQLFHGIADLARQYKVALATHLAETDDELELLKNKSGPFVPFLTELGAWEPSGLVSGPPLVIRICKASTTALLIHCNHLAPTHGIPPNASIIYCPRTHAAFGHPPHPFREFLARGVRVALGTDSLASNPDLDILAEARFIRKKHPDVKGETLLRMLTLSGAEALGWADETGSLTPGKSADLVVLPLPNEERADPHDLVFEADLPVARTLWRGEWR